MQNEMQIGQMKLAEKTALLDFLRQAYRENPRMSDERFWDWHFLENPYVEPDNLPVWIAKSGGRIAGQLAATPVKLEIGGETTSAMWILDLIVHDDFRRRGIARRLVLEAEKFCSVGLGINTTKQHSTAVLESLGWQVVGKIPRYSKMLYAGNVLPEISRIDLLRRGFNLLSAPFRPSFDKSQFGTGDGLRILENFDSAFEDLRRAASDERTCRVAREPRFLEWQFIGQPAKKFEIIGYFEKEKLLGYAVVFVRRADESGSISKASIADLFYRRENSEKIVDALLGGALEIASGRGAGSLVTDATDSLVGERLLRCGFRQVKSSVQFLVKSNRREDLLCDAQNWFLTRADSDISIFEQPNF
ncbi:MAG TPA: GNAT family N-acetyltransferase [Pyrinomonadaceae bacterium]|jgi:GNAT superfamily N-acetyltransferase